MRHKVRTDSFSRFSSYRKATMKSIVTSVLVHEKIITTKAKAKSARRLVDKMITLGKKATLAARRRAFSILCDHRLVKTLFDQIAPKFANRVGGYTRIIPYYHQRGDNAEMVVLELTEKYKEKKPVKVVKEEKDKQPAAAKKEQGVSKKEKPAKAKTEIKEEKKAHAEIKETDKPKKEDLVKSETETKPQEEAVKPEHPHAHPEEEKKKKPDVKEPKKFLKGFKGFFRKERESL
ncbi:MAG: 50S ribosomal protein L17 [Candidatus Omnitrophica bacterium]|nr:50S ribosomal protein L17 [Candidatus Omnitrophota bacterium]MDD5352229.1 50S ribosomal protein L17 [Candidatus Omnitrophota bacterium]MDD5549827.1 50S ribosomal protein L17 [Candidatus Omnitrophota bacterium]